MENFEEVYLETYEIINSFIAKRVGSSDSYDLTQEVFLRALESRINPNNVKGYLFKIARNVLVDYFKRVKKDFSINEALAQGEPFYYYEDECLGDGDPEYDLQDLIRGLSKEEQTILELRFVYDLRLKDIAEVLSKNEGSIRVKLGRILKKLRSKLEKN